MKDKRYLYVECEDGILNTEEIDKDQVVAKLVYNFERFDEFYFNRYKDDTTTWLESERKDFDKIKQLIGAKDLDKILDVGELSFFINVADFYISFSINDTDLEENILDIYLKDYENDENLAVQIRYI